MIEPTFKNFDKSGYEHIANDREALNKNLEEKTQEVLTELLPEITVTEVHRVAEWLTNNARNQEYSSKYAKIRHEVVDKSITLYKSYVKAKNPNDNLPNNGRGNSKTKSGMSANSFLSGG